MAMVGKVTLDKRLGIIDLAHGGQGIKAKVRAHQKRLGIGVADATDAAFSVELLQVLFKLGTEGGL